MANYQMKVGRYRIVLHEEHPEDIKASYRLNGIDPDKHTMLYWSSNDINEAEETLAICQKRAPAYKTYSLIDNGTEEVIDLDVGGSSRF